MTRARPEYLSYLLRLWRVRGRGQQAAETKEVWRASLESARTRKRWLFRSPEEVFDYLREQIVSHVDEVENQERDG